jgi:GNAT superfamily N-acetyltransferase
VDAEERAELLAMRDLYCAAPAELSGPTWIETAGALCLAYPQLPARELNRVIGLGLTRPTSETDLDEVLAFFAERDAPAYISLAPAAQPQVQLERWLAARGLREGYAWQKFRHGGASAGRATTQLVVRETNDGLAFARAFIAGYGMPPFLRPWFAALPGRPGWHCFVAYEGDEPVGCGGLYIEEGIAWLGMGATTPERRGLGAQSAILAARVERARDLGCREIVTETGIPGPDGPGPSYRNILRAGFVESYVRPNWTVPT